jgi:aryl-alcohol dehydrogenase-like predicted oxidoreductase
MRTRQLGRSGITVGEIGLGTWGLSGEGYGPVEPGVARATVEAALDAGVTFVETAACYGPDGAVETMLGEVMRDRGRDALTVATRLGVERPPGGIPRKAFDAVSLTAAAEASLKRLGTERVDAFVLHNPLPSTLYQSEALDALRKLQARDQTRLIGVSVGSAEVARLAIKHGVDLLVVPYNLLFPRMLHDLAPDIAASGTAVVARSPLAYGVLADTWTADRQFGENDHRISRWGPAGIARRVRQREVGRCLVAGEVRSLREAAIRYVLANKLVSVVAVGARTPEQAAENAKAADVLPYLADDGFSRIAERMSEEGIDF